MNLENPVFVLTMFCLVAGVAARSVSVRLQSMSAVDHHYWIQVASTLRARRQIPVDLGDKYLLEDSRQYYPPGFGYILSFLPPDFLRSSRAVLVVQAVDITLALITSAYVYWRFESLLASLLSGAVVLLSPGLVAYNFQLTSRSFGNLFLTSTVFSQLAAIETAGPASFCWWAVSFLLAGLTVVTHKMSTQLLVVLVAGLSLLPNPSSTRFLIVLTFPAAVVVSSLLCGRHFHLNQWRAHADIVSFWNRNWRVIGCHQLKNSPIYGDVDSHHPDRLHSPGFNGVFKRFLRIIGYQPAGIPCLVAAAWLSEREVFVWLSCVYLASFATTFVNPLKCLGSGHLYVFGGAAPIGVAGAALCEMKPNYGFSLVLLMLIANSVAICRALWLVQVRSRTSENGLDEAIEHLRSHNGVISVMPCSFAERIAAETDGSVLWGGHSLGFKKLEPYWPVMKVPFRTIVDEYQVEWLLINRHWSEGAGSLWQEEVDRLSDSQIPFGDWLLMHIRSDKRAISQSF